MPRKLYKTRLSRELHKARRAARLTVEQAANVAGVDPETVRRWERGDQKPSDKHFFKLTKRYSKGASK